MTELCFNSFNRSAYFGIDPDLPGQIDAAAAAGFAAFGPDTFSLRAWEAAGRSVAELSQRLTARGLRCFEIAAMHIGARDESVAAAREVARWAEVLRPDWVLSNIGVPIDDELFATFDEVCTILASAGCRPAIEYLPFTPAHSIATSQRIVDHVGRDRAGILFDTWHHFRGPDTWAELEAAPLDLVAYVQFDDAQPLASDDLALETVSRRAFPGEGEFDLTRYCAVMRAKGFDGVVSVEILHDGWRADPDLAAFARRAHDTSAAFWSPA